MMLVSGCNRPDYDKTTSIRRRIEEYSSICDSSNSTLRYDTTRDKKGSVTVGELLESKSDESDDSDVGESIEADDDESEDDELIEECEECGGEIDANEPNYKTPDEKFYHEDCWEKPYECRVCGDVFRSTEARNDHIRQEHDL